MYSSVFLFIYRVLLVHALPIPSILPAESDTVQGPAIHSPPMSRLVLYPSESATPGSLEQKAKHSVQLDVMQVICQGGP